MIYKTKQNSDINIAWEQLVHRLEQDNLLPPHITTSKKSVFLSSGFRWAASIAILCLCLLTVLFMRQSRTKTSESELLVLHNETNAPTLATTLEDGSIVYLSEQASIYYPDHFQKDKRAVILVGNAFFEVSNQQERPFVIDTEIAEIEVLGTFFRVKSIDTSSFHLAVRNGEVKVTLKNNNQIIYVKAGEAAQLQSGALHLSITDMQQFDNCFEKIRFKDERLTDIARIINLNSNFIPIVIDEKQGNRRLNFDYSGETPQEAAQLICMALNLNYFQKQNSIFITKEDF